MKLKVSSTSGEYASAEEMLIDEAGLDLFINGEVELGASFENLDSFQLAYAVLPEDFELADTETGFYVDTERAMAHNSTEDELEQIIWIHFQELAERRGYAK